MLRQNARIAVVAPAGVFVPARLAYTLEGVRALGYEPVLAPSIEARHRYFAGTTAQRAADLAWALTAPDIDAVWFARGGYGTAQTLALLPWGSLDSRPVIGFSDATALLVAMHKRGLRGVHGPVLHGLCEWDLGSHPPVTPIDSESRAVLRALLATGVAPALPGRPLLGDPAPVRGPVIGGNLTVLASLAGTPWALLGVHSSWSWSRSYEVGPGLGFKKSFYQLCCCWHLSVVRVKRPLIGILYLIVTRKLTVVITMELLRSWKSFIQKIKGHKSRWPWLQLTRHGPG